MGEKTIRLTVEFGHHSYAVQMPLEDTRLGHPALAATRECAAALVERVADSIDPMPADVRERSAWLDRRLGRRAAA